MSQSNEDPAHNWLDLLLAIWCRIKSNLPHQGNYLCSLLFLLSWFSIVYVRIASQYISCIALPSCVVRLFCRVAGRNQSGTETNNRNWNTVKITSPNAVSPLRQPPALSGVLWTGKWFLLCLMEIWKDSCHPELTPLSKWLKNVNLTTWLLT